MTLTKYPNGVSSCGVPLTGSVNPFGNVWFVASGTTGSNGNSGVDPDNPFETIQHAIDTGVAGDSVVLATGTHIVDTGTDGALIPKADMQFIAAIPPNGTKPSTIVTADADDLAATCTINVDGVGFHGIEFLLVAGNATAQDLFNIADTAAVSGLVFEDCWFNLNDVDGPGIVRALAIADATYGATGLVVKKCRFLGLSAATDIPICIDVGIAGIPHGLIEDNVFLLAADDDHAVGIKFIDPTDAGTPCYALVIRNNDFIGAKDGAVGTLPIVLDAGGEEGEHVMMIRTNFFAHCNAAAITADTVNQGIIQNYTWHATTGGVIVSPGS